MSTQAVLGRAFFRVLVGFGVVGAAIWRLPVMVGVVMDVSLIGLKKVKG